MEVIEFDQRRMPLGEGRYRDLLLFIAESADDPNSCWTWNGPAAVRDSDGRQVAARHLAMQVLTGEPVPLGAHITDTCGEPACLNAGHLTRGRGDACGKGHAWTAESTYWVTVKRGGDEVAERQCRTCRRDRKRAVRAASPPKPRQQAARKKPLWDNLTF